MISSAWITGASGGIGLAIAESLAVEGADLVLQYRQNAEPLKDLQLRYPDQSIELIQADFRDVHTSLEAFRGLPAPKAVIHCSGYDFPGLFQDETLLSIQNQVNADLIVPMMLTRQVVTEMINNKNGVILFITSIWGQTGSAMEVLYSTVKSGQHGLIRALSDELAPSGIRVNGIAPGFVDTPMVQGYSDEEKQSILDEIPAGRFGSPEDVARTVCFLLDDASSYINGQIIGLNGGWYRG
ncbi:elongation factor P 5-aminopentanone reductase [Salisediminibacterium selenitireducens]|uniref:Short-chain dehydrogenase/reductase SDR n=1 Tax=Bacillus selenitireducens (strain ATCC 700615 / DSM 15326 / MLS10) TaxID=439292 RepID=D6XU26_BACIE|nr:SDR family oxidoreductase [Salisediminibacterium selenitireducens]ADH99312.1 short-chain dehydrogenase/reductase SDR [[Bacillus] selenitireducens MLS10]